MLGKDERGDGDVPGDVPGMATGWRANGLHKPANLAALHTKIWSLLRGKNISTYADLTVTMFPDHLRSTIPDGLIHQGSDQHNRESSKLNMHHRQNTTTERQGHVFLAQHHIHLDVQSLHEGRWDVWLLFPDGLVSYSSALQPLWLEEQDSFHMCLPV